MSQSRNSVDWISDVPTDWEVKPICRIASADDDSLGDNPNGLVEFRYVDISSVDHVEGIKVAVSIQASEAPSRARRLAKQGDVVVSTVRTYLKAVAEVTEEYSDCVFSTGFAVLRANPSALSEGYLKWALLNENLIQAIESHSEGLSYPAINTSELVKLKVVVPPISIQLLISAYLDRATARIDTLAAKKSRFIELMREKIIALATRCQVEETTRWVRLKQCGAFVSRPVKQIAGDSYTRLGLYNRGRGIFKKDAADQSDMGESDFHWVEDGDLILSGQFAWEGAVAMARAEHAGCVVSHRYPILRGNSGEVLSEYLYAYFSTPHGDMILNDCSRGSAGRNRPLNVRLLMDWKIPIPPMEIQMQIAALILKKEKSEILQRNSVELLKEHRAALITAAVTGKIDLRGER